MAQPESMPLTTTPWYLFLEDSPSSDGPHDTTQHMQLTAVEVPTETRQRNQEPPRKLPICDPTLRTSWMAPPRHRSSFYFFSTICSINVGLLSPSGLAWDQALTDTFQGHSPAQIRRTGGCLTCTRSEARLTRAIF